jgi:hypothetical protein
LKKCIHVTLARTQDPPAPTALCPRNKRVPGGLLEQASDLPRFFIPQLYDSEVWVACGRLIKARSSCCCSSLLSCRRRENSERQCRRREAKRRDLQSCRSGPEIEMNRRHIPQDGILHGHRLEALKSYIISMEILLRRLSGRCLVRVSPGILAFLSIPAP